MDQCGSVSLQLTQGTHLWYTEALLRIVNCASSKYQRRDGDTGSKAAVGESHDLRAQAEADNGVS